MRKSPLGIVLAIIFFLGLAISSLLIWKSGILIRTSGYELIGDFDNVNGLLVGAQVRYRGYQIGQINKIVPTPTRIEVRFWVRNEISIPQNSYLRVVFDGLVGEKYVNIVPCPTANQMVKFGQHLKGYSTSGLADFVDEGTKSLIQAKEILAVVNQLAQTKSITQAIQETIENLGAISAGIRQFTDTVLINGHADAKLLETATNLSTLTAKLSKSSDDLNRLLSNPNTQGIPQKAYITLDNLASLTGELNKLISDPSVQSDLKVLLKSSRETVTHAAGILKAASQVYSAGTIGLGSKNGKIQYDGLLDIGMNSGFVRVGPDIIQAGVPVNSKTTARIGATYGQPGIGIDYQMSPSLKLSADIYNPTTVNADVMGSWKLSDPWAIRMGGTQIMSDDRRLHAGLFYTW